MNFTMCLAAFSVLKLFGEVSASGKQLLLSGLLNLSESRCLAGVGGRVISESSFLGNRAAHACRWFQVQEILSCMLLSELSSCKEMPSSIRRASRVILLLHCWQASNCSTTRLSCPTCGMPLQDQVSRNKALLPEGTARNLHSAVYAIQYCWQLLQPNSL